MNTAISSDDTQVIHHSFQGQDEILALEEKEEARLNLAKKKFEDEELKVRAAEEEKRKIAEQVAKDNSRSILQRVTETEMPSIGGAQEAEAKKECEQLRKAFDTHADKAVASLVESVVSSDLLL